MNSLSLTRKLLSFDTINPSGQERNCAKYLGKLLENVGFKTDLYEFADRRTSLVARIGGSNNKPPICFTGHIDTVPLGAASWTKDPLIGEIERDRIYGRGSSDMKSGVAAMVITALRLGKLLNGTAGITLVITAGEETGSQGAYHLRKLGNALGKAGAIVVGEPSSNYPLVCHKGALWLETRFSGITAHGSMPEKGINAIYKTAQAVIKLQKFDFNCSSHPLLGLPSINVGTIKGGANINSVPDQVLVGIDIRTIPGQSNEDVYKKLQSYLGEEIELKPLVNVGSISTDPEHEWVQQVFDIMESFLGERPVPRGVTYFTDASVLTPAFNNPPTVILGPGEPAMAHKTDEFCYVSKIEEAAEAYVKIAKKWCRL